MASRLGVVVPAVLIALLPAQEPAERIVARVDQYMAALSQMDLFSGTVLLARGGEIVVHKAWGLADRERRQPNTTETQFKLMSTSKTLTGTVVMRLVQDGKLALHDPVGKHLPDWPKVWSAVTVHDLLDHTSGIPNLEVEWGTVSRSGDERGLEVWRAFAAKAARPLATAPGTVHSYSNFNTVLAACVAEAASGRSYRELVHAIVLKPAGMMATTFDDGGRHGALAIGYMRGADGAPAASEQDMSHIQGAGSACSTAGDLYRFDRALRGDRLLDAATRKAMFTPRLGQYACCWVDQKVHGRPCLQHSGGANGYVADFLRFPDDDACVVVLSNFAFAPIMCISRDLAAILFGLECPVPQVCESAQLDACAGVYQWPAIATKTIVRRCGKTLVAFDLYAGDERCAGHTLVPIGNGTFADAMGMVHFVFEKERARRLHAGGEVVLPRVAVPRAEWPGSGELTATPPIGKRVSFAKDADRLWLRIEEGWPPSLEILPVDGTLALALYAFDGGTLLHREGKQYRWQRADGAEFRLEGK